MGGWFITTTSDLGTNRCQSIMATFLRAMSATSSPPPFKLTVLGMMLPSRELPNLLHRSPAKLLRLVRLSVEAAGVNSQVDTATFEQTGDPLLLIGRGSGQRSQGDTAEALYLSPFQ